MSEEQQDSAQGKRADVKTILIVEDDNNIGEVFVQAILQETPYMAILALNGQEALKIVAGIKPNLFILDYQLPRMNGLDLYDKLHAIEGLETVPAIMMSARLPLQELEKRRLIGMHKPIDLDEFLQTLERLLD